MIPRASHKIRLITVQPNTPAGTPGGLELVNAFQGHGTLPGRAAMQPALLPLTQVRLPLSSGESQRLVLGRCSRILVDSMANSLRVISHDFNSLFAYLSPQPEDKIFASKNTLCWVVNSLPSMWLTPKTCPNIQDTHILWKVRFPGPKPRTWAKWTTQQAQYLRKAGVRVGRCLPVFGK